MVVPLLVWVVEVFKEAHEETLVRDVASGGVWERSVGD